MDIINKIVGWLKTRIGYYEHFKGFYYPRTVGYDKHQVANMLNAGVPLASVCEDACNLSTKCSGISCKKCMFHRCGETALIEFLQHEGLIEKEDN